MKFHYLPMSLAAMAASVSAGNGEKTGPQDTNCDWETYAAGTMKSPSHHYRVHFSPNDLQGGFLTVNCLANPYQGGDKGDFQMNLVGDFEMFEDDRAARQKWLIENGGTPKQFPGGAGGKFYCKKGRWNQLKETPACPDSNIDNAWVEFMKPPPAPVVNPWKDFKRRNAIDTISMVRNMGIYFKIKLEGKVRGWSSIIHVNRGHNAQRQPGLWFSNNSYNLHLAVSSYCNNKYWNQSVKNFNTGWKTGQTHVIGYEKWGNYVTVLLDGKPRIRMAKKNQCQSGRSNVYMGDQWYAPTNAKYANYKYSNWTN